MPLSLENAGAGGARNGLDSPGAKSCPLYPLGQTGPLATVKGAYGSLSLGHTANSIPPGK